MRANLIHGKIPEPRSLQWALTRHRQVLFEINKVEGQLADSTRVNRYKTQAEYDTWRGSAEHVVRLFRAEETQLAAWIATNNADGESLFKRAYELLQDLEADCGDFDAEESELMRLLDIHFGTKDQERSTG